ncbi:MAG: efflux RND transporter periplasmic adaptor subunit, partial [Acidobacteria bacterium]|nr:efflux RND transporter periplasmic adaptor subunit [Acidobacteriota bacterium]
MKIRWNRVPSRHSLAAAVTALAALAAAACGGGGSAGGHGGPGGPGGMPAMPVGLVTLTPQPVEQLGEFVGTVRSRQATTIRPQAEGFVTKIYVHSGDRVKKGARILDIDSTSQQAAVASLESQRAARQADATFAEQRAQRLEALLGTGAISQQDYDQAEAQLQDARAQLQSVEDQIRQQKNELGYFHVVAPTEGVVGDIPVNVGDSVSRSTVLTTVDANAGLEVYVGVPVQQAPQLVTGLPVRLVTDNGGVIAESQISFVAPSVDDATQTVLVKAPVPADAGLRTSQFVRTQIVWTTEPTLTIPLVSVIRVNGQHFAFLAQPGDGGG